MFGSFAKLGTNHHNGGMAQVVFEHVCKSFDKTDVIKDISLKVSDREFMVLVGPSGCGKSTLLRMIAGLETPTSGEISIGERVVNNVPPKDRDIAMVFQNYALYPHMTVFDNMAFGLKMRKFPKEEIGARVKDAARILDLEHLLERRPKQLSGGQRQRVALGRAIVRDPKVFLMDEPLSNLDAKLRVQMRAEIAKLHQRLNATTVYVTHDQVEAMTMGDRIVILNQGVIQQVDTPMQIYTQPGNLFVAGFIGQMNFLEGTLDKGSFLLNDGTRLPLSMVLAQKAIPYEGKKVILGIRPEHLEMPQQGTPTIEILPDLIEMLGSEQMVHFVLGGTAVVAKIPSEFQVALKTPVTLQLNLEHAHLFDPETECRIS
jgi:multiple sugar transport system ATP-binding protein